MTQADDAWERVIAQSQQAVRELALGLGVLQERLEGACDALLSLEASLRERLLGSDRFEEKQFLQVLEHHPGFPVVLTEPRFTTVAEDQPDGWRSSQCFRRAVRPAAI